MKKLLFLIQLAALVAVYSSPSFASGGNGKKHGRGHHKHKTVVVEKHYYHEPEVRYYRAPAPAPVLAPPPPPQPRYSSPDQRSTQGLVGGAVGSALGYELGKGDPVASGLGAAAGAYIGNGMNGR